VKAPRAKGSLRSFRNGRAATELNSLARNRVRGPVHGIIIGRQYYPRSFRQRNTKIDGQRRRDTYRINASDFFAIRSADSDGPQMSRDRLSPTATRLAFAYYIGNGRLFP
jgi:hypothetical protein